MMSRTWLADPVNGFRARETLIGMVHTPEPREHTVLYETASWWTKVEVPAGDYEIVLHKGHGTAWVMVRYHGIVTDEHFVNRVFWATSLAAKRNVGQPMRCAAQLYPFVAAEQFETNPEWELAEDWRVVDGRLETPDGVAVH